ncbi:MAG: hypothetical protein O2897_03215, partial [bacterium]|nr:hypothetical protein [bacterium]
MKMFRFFDPVNELNFVQYFKTSIVVAALIPLLAIVGAAFMGLNWGIDFTGGAEMQIQFAKQVDAEDIREVLEDLGFDKNQVQRYGPKDSNEMLVRVERLSMFKPEDMKNIKEVINKNFAEELKSHSDKPVEVLFNKNVSDRFSVKIPEPDVAKASSAEQVSAALTQQHH